MFGTNWLVLSGCKLLIILKVSDFIESLFGHFEYPLQWYALIFVK